MEQYVAIIFILCHTSALTDLAHDDALVELSTASKSCEKLNIAPIWLLIGYANRCMTTR